MLQGWLASLLLSFAVVITSPAVASKEMAKEEVNYWLNSKQVQLKVSEFVRLVEKDEIDSLKFSINRLALPQQEVARFLLLQNIEQRDIILTSKMAIFVRGQQSLAPTYTVLERGEGYEFSVPAFNYPAISSRLIKQWQNDQKTLDFILLTESGQLNLREWLSEGSDYDKQNRESVLVNEFDSLSPRGSDFLIGQLTNTKVTEWLPSTRVLVRMAQESEDEQLYQLLWKMRADHNSQSELERLAALDTPFSQQQIMLAAMNPSLKNQALSELAQINPLPDEVKQFLVSRMTTSDDASFVAQQLAQYGHSGWVRDVVSTNSDVKENLILRALSN
ncbi:hypothetical protein [Vibrio methylphosphonaticus]|uniref:hypothetical protein n=1 Tax=Vibrio methylphosphonaticus TaxID=2946866 RepID=UPI00202A3D71|nr:hypothetical protein [Vibrio methylphosphonaticus]MCL9777406.1 hypothetical protein [Vibrio methylphosphonaticus]